MGVSPGPLPPCPCCHSAPCSQKGILGHLEVPSLLGEPAQDGSPESHRALVLPRGGSGVTPWPLRPLVWGWGVSMGWEVSMAGAILTLGLLHIWDFSLSSSAELTGFVQHLQR